MPRAACSNVGAPERATVSQGDGRCNERERADDTVMAVSTMALGLVSTAVSNSLIWTDADRPGLKVAT